MSILDRLQDSEEYTGDEAIPLVAEEAYEVIADLVAALKGYEALMQSPPSPARAQALKAHSEVARAALAKAGAA